MLYFKALPAVKNDFMMLIVFMAVFYLLKCVMLFKISFNFSTFILKRIDPKLSTVPDTFKMSNYLNSLSFYCLKHPQESIWLSSILKSCNLNSGFVIFHSTFQTSLSLLQNLSTKWESDYESPVTMRLELYKSSII